MPDQFESPEHFQFDPEDLSPALPFVLAALAGAALGVALTWLATRDWGIIL